MYPGMRPAQICSLGDEDRNNYDQRHRKQGNEDDQDDDGRHQSRQAAAFEPVSNGV
jgi:hypothetical protein